MHCVIGLGNPGKIYELTRHNIGYLILDFFAKKHNLSFKPAKGDYYYSEGTIVSSDFILIKPITYMNLSGLAVLDVIEESHILTENLLVVIDDVNLDLGKIRLRKSGGDGGHNGLKSIIYHLQSVSFPRLRFGIGKSSKNVGVADYVLDKFRNDEFDQIKDKLDLALELIEEFIVGGYKAMSDHFSKKSQIQKSRPEDKSNEIV